VRAAFCSQPGEVVVRDVDDLVPGEGEAVVRVVACGICGSDLHWYNGTGVPPAVCPGHEIVGEVAAVGSAGGVREGDRVAIEPLRACRRCERCLRGDYHLCGKLRILGLSDDGGLADQVIAPLESLFVLPAGLPVRDAVLTEPLAVAVHAARIGGVDAGTDRVLVLGAGSIGLLSVVAARAMGAGEILVTARHPHQADAARRLGADRVFSTDDEGRAALAEAARETDIDVVLETVGGEARTLQQGIFAVGPGGTVVVLGVFTKDPSFPALVALAKEVRVIGSMVYNRSGGVADFERTLDILADRREVLVPLITHRFSLADVDRAFQTAADKSTGAVKVVIEP
jgi:L-iditol 2-dehydrogenase